MWYLYIIVGIAALVVGALIGFVIGRVYRRNATENTITTAKQEAARIVTAAVSEAETKKKETLLEAKDEIHRLRTEADKELRERRSEVQRQERRLVQKEENIDKKLENLEHKEENLNKKLKNVEEKLLEVETVKRSQFEMLEKISGYTKEQAKDYLLKTLEDELIHEKAAKIMEYDQKLHEEADEKARQIISCAIQRCAAGHAAEATVSVIPLPDDELKGRIIGREGRNIRTLESMTGVDLIIDDTP